MATGQSVAKTPAETKVKKAKKASAPKAKSPPLHPPYSEMIKEAIASLKERNGSSSQAIAKFTQEKYKNLPANYKKLLSTQLKKQVAAGKLVKVKASFKISPKNTADSSAPAVKPKTAVKKPSAKPKTATKKAPAKKKAVTTATKPKTTAKPKAPAPKAKPAAKPKAAAAPKAKPAAKPKAAAKPKTPTKPAAKAAKTSTRATPGRAAAASKPAAKKISVKKTPSKKAGAPKKAATTTKKGKK